MKVPWRKRLWRGVRGHFRSRILARHGVAILADTKNGTLAVDPADFNVSRQLLTGGEYDWREVKALSRLVDSRSRIAVVGAHIGAVLIPLVRLAGTGHAIAYEPSPRNFRLLQLNLIQNGLADIVIAKNIALGERWGRTGFIENPINTGNSRLTAGRGTVEVALDTLDATIPRDWGSVDLLAMDVEGSEVRAMLGAAQTLQKTKHFYVEFAPDQLREQGSTVSEFLELTAAHFQSARIMGAMPQHFDIAAFSEHLRGLQARRGLLLNILFSKNASAAP